MGKDTPRGPCRGPACSCVNPRPTPHGERKVASPRHCPEPAGSVEGLRVPEKISEVLRVLSCLLRCPPSRGRGESSRHSYLLPPIPQPAGGGGTVQPGAGWIGWEAVKQTDPGRSQGREIEAMTEKGAFKNVVLLASPREALEIWGDVLHTLQAPVAGEATDAQKNLSHCSRKTGRVTSIGTAHRHKSVPSASLPHVWRTRTERSF